MALATAMVETIAKYPRKMIVTHIIATPQSNTQVIMTIVKTTRKISNGLIKLSVHLSHRIGCHLQLLHHYLILG